MGEQMRKGTTQSKIIIKFHPSYYLMALGFILTGYYLNLIIFTVLILVHECGHIIAAKLCKIKVKQTIIYPYGGKTILEDYINRDIHQELFVASFGVITQFFFYLLICFLHQKYFIRSYTMNLFTQYNSQIIFFNLMFIYPLDGGKILNMIFCMFFPYQLANSLTVFISLINLFLLIIIHIYEYNYSNLMILLILFYYLLTFYRKRKYLYQKFLLERYLYSINFIKKKKISNIKKMYRNRTHLIKKNKTYHQESEILEEYFKKN